ncbi:hypothetical protein N7539_008664 [Penicillium diatomitis]|uniref:Uncharacterized protein n=1 Tax=Penicillium diatomitis TaxID=2819901 RepID=A0A9W9WR12_9EURO|nr:uncharacterized protein N7539_008664 [Penicillium diatomitis]KAJ5472095.1 hypothetical protein N7539_008664 [Penicillium diatomitis]
MAQQSPLPPAYWEAAEEVLSYETSESESDETSSSESERGDESEHEEPRPDQELQLSGELSPISKIPFVFVVNNKRFGVMGSVKYSDRKLNAEGSQMFAFVRDIHIKLTHLLLDGNALQNALILEPEFRERADDLTADSTGTLRTLHLPAEAMNDFSREQQRNFAGWLYASVDPSETRLHLTGSGKRKATLNEDAKYALCMLVDGKLDHFSRYLSARPEMIDELSSFHKGYGIFTRFIIPKIAPQISTNYLMSDLYHDSRNIRRIAHSVYLWLREEFGDKPMENYRQDEKVEHVLALSAIGIDEGLTTSQKFKVFGMIYGSIQGGALRHMAVIQRRQEWRNKMASKMISELIAAGLQIPGIFCVHWGGIVLSFGAALIKPWTEEAAKKVMDKVMPVTGWFTFMHGVIQDQLDDLENWVDEHIPPTQSNDRADLEDFICYARFGLRKGLPDIKYDP